MSDLALIYRDGIIDLDLGDGGEAIDEGLRTALIISLFTDRLAGPADRIPDGSDDRRGWWGDVYPGIDDDLTGSRLWLLDREKELPAILRMAETYAREALQWMLDDSVATRVEVSADNPQAGVLALEIRLKSVSGQDYEYRVAIAAPGTVNYSQVFMIVDSQGFAITDRSGAILSGRS